MGPLTIMILMGLANWLATLIIVESELTAGIRAWADRRYAAARRLEWFWYKVRYLLGCHLCAGTWVGLVMSAFLDPVASSGVVGWVLTGLVVKAIGHLGLLTHRLAERLIDGYPSPDLADILALEALDEGGDRNAHHR